LLTPATQCSRKSSAWTSNTNAESRTPTFTLVLSKATRSPRLNKKAHRKSIGRFNNKFNGDVDDGLLDPPAGNVRSLSVLKVAPRSILVKKGFVDLATELFASAAEQKYRRENGQGVVRLTMNLSMLANGGTS
jgi:hypothetical protein